MTTLVRHDNGPSFCSFATTALLLILAVGIHELGTQAPLMYLLGVGMAKLMVTGLLGGCTGIFVSSVTDMISDCQPNGWIADHQFELVFATSVATTLYLCFSLRAGIPIPM